jgi:NADH dehydrogenase FAD-containing subunit
LERASQPNISDEERRRLLTFVIIGAGPTGVEYTGELEDFLSDVIGFGRNVDGIKRSVAPFANLADFTRVILVQGAKDVLPQFDEDLRASARDVLEKEGVEVLTNTRVTRIESERVIISSQMENGESMEKTINCGIIVWAGGTKPIKLTEQLISNIDTYYVNKHNIQHEAISSLAVNGRIPVDKWLRVVGTPGNVLAMGDASVTVGKNTRVLPQTAQVAAQQGAYVARLLNRDYKLSGESMKHNTSEGNNDEMEKDGQANLYLNPPYNVDAMNGNLSTKLRLQGAVSAKPFEFLNLGQLAYLGGGEALSQVQLGDRHLFNQAGSSGFLLWKSVYIVKQVSTKTRLLVLFDWFSTKIFGRDVTRM